MKELYFVIVFWCLWNNRAFVYSAACDESTLQNLGGIYFDDNIPSGPAEFVYMEAIGGGSQRSLWDLEAHCYDICDSTGVDLLGRIATFEQYDDYATIRETLQAQNKLDRVIFGAVGYNTGTNLKDFRWAAYADVVNKSIITIKTNVSISVESCAPKLALAFDPDEEGKFYAHDWDNLSDYPFVCQCQCPSTQYNKLPSTSPSWDPNINKLSISGTNPCWTTTVESVSFSTSQSSTAATISSSGSISQYVTSSALSQPSPATGSASSVIMPGICDDAIIQSFQSSIASSPSLSPFDGNLFFDEPTTSTVFWYGYEKDLLGRPSNLIEMDGLCSSKCTGFDSRLYGRSAVLRSRVSYEAVYVMINSTGYIGLRSGVIVGAASNIRTTTTVDKFSWTTVNTNQPNPANPIATQQVLEVFANPTVGPVNALGLDVFQWPVQDALFSFDATKLDHGYLCECGCAPYIPVESTASGWDNIITTTAFTSTTTSESRSTVSLSSSSSTSATSPAATASAIGSSSAQPTISARSTDCDPAELDALVIAAQFGSTHPFNSTLSYQESFGFDPSLWIWYGYVGTYNGNGPTDLIGIDNTCYNKCQSIDQRLYGRTAVLRSMAAYEKAYEMISTVPLSFGAVIGAASDRPSPSTLDQFRWTTINTNEPSPSSPITNQSTLTAYFISGYTGSVNALAINPKKQYPQTFFYCDVTRLNRLDYICECGCAPYVQVGSTIIGWDLTTTTLSSTTTSNSTAQMRTSTSISSPQSATPSSTSVPRSITTDRITAQSTSNVPSGVCDNAFMQLLTTDPVLMTAFDDSLFYNESYNGATYWYGYVMDTATPGPSSLAAMDSDCARKCKNANPLLHGRSAILRTWETYEIVFLWLKGVGYCTGCRPGVIIGAVSTTTTTTTLDKFFWSIVDTNNPNPTKQVTNKADVFIYKKGNDGITMALGIDLSPYLVAKEALFSYDATALDHGYLCECGCVQYAAHSSTVATSTTTTAGTMMASTSTVPAQTSNVFSTIETSTSTSTSTSSRSASSSQPLSSGASTNPTMKSTTTFASTTENTSTGGTTSIASSPPVSTGTSTMIGALTSSVLLSTTSGTCDSSTVLEFKNAILIQSLRSPFTDDVFYTHQDNKLDAFTVWYGYVNAPNPGAPSSLREMDDSCSAKCHGFDPRMYGRTAVFRSLGSCEYAFEFLVANHKSDTRFVMIGAASITTGNTTLNRFSWTTVSTDLPDPNSPITSQSWLQVTQVASAGAMMALGLDLAQPEPHVFFSFDNTKLNGVDYLCECQCAPYIAVGSTTDLWDIATTAATTTPAATSTNANSPSTDAYTPTSTFPIMSSTEANSASSVPPSNSTTTTLSTSSTRDTSSESSSSTNSGSFSFTSATAIISTATSTSSSLPVTNASATTSAPAAQSTTLAASSAAATPTATSLSGVSSSSSIPTTAASVISSTSASASSISSSVSRPASSSESSISSSLLTSSIGTVTETSTPNRSSLSTARSGATSSITQSSTSTSDAPATTESPILAAASTSAVSADISTTTSSIQDMSTPSTQPSTSGSLSTSSSSSSSRPASTTVQSTYESTGSTAATLQSLSETTFITDSSISSRATSAPTSAPFTPSSSSTSTGIEAISSAELRSTSAADISSPNLQSSTHYISSSEGSAIDLSSSIEFTSSSADDLGSESSSTASSTSPTTTGSTSPTTQGDSTAVFSTTETVQHTSTQLTTSVGITSEQILSTLISTVQSTSLIELATDDYNEANRDTVTSRTVGSDSAWPQEFTTILDLDSDESSKLFLADLITSGPSDATGELTALETTEEPSPLDQAPSTTNIQVTSTDSFSFSSSSTSAPATHPSSSPPTAAASGNGANGSRRGMARTEGTMAPYYQLVMETESITLSEPSAPDSTSKMATEKAPTTLNDLNEVTKKAESSDDSRTTPTEFVPGFQDDQDGQEIPLDPTIDPVGWKGKELDHTSTWAQTQFITTIGRTEQSRSTAVRDISTAIIQRRSNPTSTPASQPPSVSTYQVHSSISVDPYVSQSTAAANSQSSQTTTILSETLDLLDTTTSLSTANTLQPTSFRESPSSFLSTSPENPTPIQSQTTATSESKPTSSEIVDLSFPRSAPNLPDLRTPALFRLPPNVHIDNSITLLPRSKLSTTPDRYDFTLSPSSSPNPLDPRESSTNKIHQDQSPQDSGESSTGSTETERFGNAGNLSHSSPQTISRLTPAEQSSTGRGTPTSTDLAPNPFTDSRSFMGFSGSDPPINSAGSSLATVSTSTEISEEPYPDGDKGSTRIPSNSSNGSTTSAKPNRAMSANRDTAASSLKMASQNPLWPPGTPGSAEEPSHLNQSPTAPGSANSTMERSTATILSQPIQIDQRGIVINPESLVIPNGPEGTTNQSTAPPDQAASKSSDPASSALPNRNQQAPNDPDTTDGEFSGQPMPTNPRNDPNNLEAKPSTETVNEMSPGESPNAQDPSRAPPESMHRLSPDSSNSDGETDVSANSMGATEPMASLGPSDIVGSTAADDHGAGPGPTETTDTAQLGPTGPNATVTSDGLVAHPLEPAIPMNPTAPSTPATSSMSTLDPNSDSKPSEPTQLTNPGSTASSAELSPSSSHQSSTSPSSKIDASSSPTNGTEDSLLSGSVPTQAFDPSAGDMDENDVKGARPADPMSKPERLAVSIMHSLGCVWVVACSGACFVLGMITNYRSPDRQLSYTQELSLMLQHLFILLWHDATEHNTLCTAVSISIQYFTLVYYTSMLLDSIRNLFIIVAFLDRANQIPGLAMQAVAWGTPALITSASAITYYKHYDSDFSCWINANHPVALFTIAPVGLMSALGIIINEASGTLMPCQLVPKGLKDSFHTSFISRHGFFFVLPLSISSWAIGFAAVFYQNLPVYVTVSGINIGLGVALVFFHALQNDQIRALLKRMWMKIKDAML